MGDLSMDASSLNAPDLESAHRRGRKRRRSKSNSKGRGPGRRRGPKKRCHQQKLINKDSFVAGLADPNGPGGLPPLQEHLEAPTPLGAPPPLMMAQGLNGMKNEDYAGLPSLPPLLPNQGTVV